MKKSFIFLADGFEEIEALATVDILRRAGIEVNTVTISPTLQVKGAHGVEVKADISISDVKCNENDILVLPGGMPGATNLANCTQLSNMLVQHHNKKGTIAAICASPAVVLAPLNILEGKEATCYPGFEGAFTNCKKGYNPVVVDGNIITANGPATAIPFALTIVAKSLCEEKSREVAEGMLVYNPQQEYNF